MSQDYTRETLPAVETVYPLAIQSYETAIKRFDTVDSKLNTIVTFAVTVSLAIPVIANTKSISFRSWWFLLAAVAFVSGVGLITYARITGRLMLLDPRTLYDSYMDLDEWQFKRHMIDWAGDNWRQNQSLINRNGVLGAIAATLFAVEAVAVAAWVVAAVTP